MLPQRVAGWCKATGHTVFPFLELPAMSRWAGGPYPASKVAGKPAIWVATRNFRPMFWGGSSFLSPDHCKIAHQKGNRLCWILSL